MSESRSVAQASSVVSTAKKARRPNLKTSGSHSFQSTNRTLLGSPRKEVVVLETSKPEDMNCFQQFCANCERLITTPCSSILYCSQKCEEQDGSKPLSASNIMSATTSPSKTPSSPRPILQPRTPTGVRPFTDTPSVRIPADNHSYKADLDPTEWKPKATRGGRPATNRYNSEAFRYLSSFHRSINKNNDINEYNDTPNDVKIDIADMNANAGTVPTTPSLGNTPTTTASSWSLSTSAGYTGIGNGGYDYNRPLMPRHNRWYSTSAISGNGIDLVTPHIPPPPAHAYAKKDLAFAGETPRGGLDAFFGSD